MQIKQFILLALAGLGLGMGLFFWVQPGVPDSDESATSPAEKADGPKKPEDYQKIRWEVLQGLDPMTGAASDPLLKALESPLRIPGFIVPLEVSGRNVREFLLVPTQGACIHLPPPPGNQMIFALVDEGPGIPAREKTAPVWIHGNMEIDGQETQWGIAGYTMRVQLIEPYTGGY